MRPPARTFLLGLWLALPLAALGAPYRFDRAPGRLPKSVEPLNYSVAVTPDMDAGTIAGSESVTLLVRDSTGSLTFNSLNEKLTDVRFDGAPVAAVVTDDERQLTTVRLARQARAGEHTLTFAYTARLETQPHGMFLQTYLRPDGTQGRLISTKMESTDARRMFPCWDEPAFRATFELTVTVPADWATVSNMPLASRTVRGELATTRFERSPKMPSYLIEFTGGDLGAIEDMVGTTRLGVWTVRGRETQGEIALADAQLILADYNEYFGVRFPLPKLDAIAVPGGFTGAMENWGAITYNDRLLLLTPGSTVAERQAAFALQAHEIAHQWSGDLVTMGWWDDLWLNESFAAWRGAKETDERHPEWHWWEQQDAAREQAMSADARRSTHPIQQPVADELQAANAFDDITYQKGQAVLRMLESYLGPEVFRDGIRRYMRVREYSNATATDLWRALGAVGGREVVKLARDWTEQPGFPIVGVAAVCNARGERSIVLAQRRFLLEGRDHDGSRWRIPLRIRVGSGAARTELLRHDGQRTAAGRCDEPLSVNADAVGFYRVKYDALTLATNTRAFASLPAGDRIALLDDAWALGVGGGQSLESYLALASAMGGERDARAWEQIAAALGTLEYDERGAAGHEAFTAAARALLRPAADSLGFDSQPGETPDVQRLRRTLLEDLGSWDDGQVLGEARRRFARFLSDRGAIAADDQDAILSIVAHGADAATFEQLHALARDEKDESAQRRYYLALMQVGDDALAERAAQIALSPEIPPQEAGLRMTLVVRLRSRHAALAWRTFTTNADILLAPHPKYAPLITAQYVPEYFWDAVSPQELEAWVRARLPAEMAPNIARGMETVRVLRAEKAALVPETDAWLAGAAAPRVGGTR